MHAFTQNMSSPSMTVNTMNSNKYQGGQGPSPINPSPLAPFGSHPINPSPMLSGEPWRPETSNGQVETYSSASATAMPTPGTAGFPPQNTTVPFNNNGHVSSLGPEYGEGNRWSHLPPAQPSSSSAYVSTDQGPYAEMQRTRPPNHLQTAPDHPGGISFTRTPNSAVPNASLPTGADVGASTSPNDRDGSSRRRLADEEGEGKEDSQESERTETKGSGSKSRSRRQPNGPWREEEAEKLKRLAEDSKGKNPNIAADEIDWDYVVTGFKNTRTRHQILIKAVYLGIRRACPRSSLLS
jgi:hypothetical protein